MDINKKVMTMEEDTYELVKHASAIYGYSKDLEERLHLCLLSHMYKKHREEGIDYNDLQRNITTQICTVPIDYKWDTNFAAHVAVNFEDDKIMKKLFYSDSTMDGATIDVSSLYHELEHLIMSYHIEKDNSDSSLVFRTGFALVSELPDNDFSIPIKNEFINEAITLNEESKLPKIVSDLSNYSLKLINIDALKNLIPSSSQIMSRNRYRTMYNLVKPMIDIMSNEINVTKYYGGVEDFEDSYDQLIGKQDAFRKLSKNVDSFYNLERGSTKPLNKWFTKDYYGGKINSNMKILKEKAYQKRK